MPKEWQKYCACSFFRPHLWWRKWTWLWDHELRMEGIIVTEVERHLVPGRIVHQVENPVNLALQEKGVSDLNRKRRLARRSRDCIGLDNLGLDRDFLLQDRPRDTILGVL